MTQYNFDSMEMAPAQRLRAWKDIICDVYTGLDCRSDLGDTFHGAIAATQLGAVGCTQVVSTAQKVHRSPERIARAREEHVFVYFAEQGTACLHQDGKEVVMRPGHVSVHDSTRPYDVSFQGTFRHIILKLPREQICQRFGETERLTATAFTRSDPLGKLAFDFVESAVAVSTQVPPAARSVLSTQMVDLLSLAWSERLAIDPRETSHYRSAMLLRLKAFIREHLADPDLSIAMAGRALGVSTRTINSLLEIEQTSFRAYVLSQRLEMCRKQLAERGLTHVRIGEFAFSWGFNDLAYFSRSFRQRFGCSPREWRYLSTAHAAA